MPSQQDTPVFTYHTRVSLTPEQDQILREYAILFGHVERTLFADIEKGKHAKDLKSAYLARFGITARQFNALRIQLLGKIQAIRKQIPLRIENLKTKIQKAKKTIVELVQSIPGSNQLHQKRRRLANLQTRLERLEADEKTGRVHICFGSKRLFCAQYYLDENGFGSHAEWHEAWTEARSRQFFVIGSKDETAGCQGCVAVPEENGSYSLRLRLPTQASARHLFITGVRFAYGQEQFEESLACGRALSYRFLRDEKGWRVFVSTEASPVERITDKRLGAVGIDINPDQLVLAQVDRSGNFVGGEHIACLTAGKTQEQTKAILGDAVKLAIAVAIRTCKPIIMERLDFEKKKAALENEGSKRARMLSSFAYRQMIQHLKAAAFRAGVGVIEVNPAYTSTIGAVNYAARYGISIHQGAAIAIARRGLGLSERPAARVVELRTAQGDHVTLHVPVRNRAKHVWSLWSKVSRQIRAALTAHGRLLLGTAGSTPGSLCSQTQCAT